MTLTASTNDLNLQYHFENIINGYLGQACTLRRITTTLDPNGGIVDESVVETDIIGIISPASGKVLRENAGLMIAGDLVAYFMRETGINVGTQSTNLSTTFDNIIYKNIIYSIEEKIVTARDGETAIVDKFILREVSGE